MNYPSLMKFSAIGLISCTLIACGGGESDTDGILIDTNTADTSDTDNNVDIPLAEDAQVESFSTTSIFPRQSGTVIDFKLTGTYLGQLGYLGEKAVVEVIGNLNLADRAQITQNGSLVIPREQLTSLRINDVMNTFFSTEYYDLDGNFLSAEYPYANVNCTVSSPYSLMPTVKVSEFGTFPPMTCSNGTESVSNWRVERVDNTRANIIISHSFKTQNTNDYVRTQEKLYQVDETGKVLNIQLSNYENNYWIERDGDVTFDGEPYNFEILNEQGEVIDEIAYYTYGYTVISDNTN